MNFEFRNRYRGKVKVQFEIYLYFLLFILILILHSNFVNAQNSNVIDSLRIVINNEKEKPENRLEAYKGYILKTFYNNTSDALPDLKKYIKLATQFKNPTRLAHAYHCLSFYYRMQRDYDSAFYASNECLRISLAARNSYYVANAIIDQGVIFEDQGKYEEAIDVYSMALDSAILSKEKVMEARCRINIGMLNQIRGNYILALRELFIAMKICEENNINGFMASTLQSIAEINSIIGAYEEAEQYFLKALMWSEKQNNQNTERLTLKNYSQMKLDIGDTVGAEILLKRLAESSKQSDIVVEQSIAIYRMADLFRIKGQLDSAENYILQSIMILSNISHTNEESKAKSIAGNIYLEKRNFLEAKKYCKESYQLNTNLKDLELQIKNCNCLYKSFLEIGKADSALKYFEEYHLLFRKQTDKIQVREIVRIQLTNEYEEEKNEAELISKQKVERQRTFTIYAIILACLILTLTLVMFLALRSNYKKNKILNSQKEKLEKSDNEKEILLKEIHHRVKNNLQIICSLLEIQSLNTKNEEVVSLLLEGQNRVKSMSLIHQSLYQKENLTSISFEDYTKNLISQLITAYKFYNIDVDLNITEGNFDIDTAIPLGLILNELITNSIKYAFPKTAEPKLNIDLIELENGLYRLTLSDNGPGINSELNPSKMRTTGMQLVYGLSRQLFGKLTYENNSGCTFVLEFKNTNLRNKLA